MSQTIILKSISILFFISLMLGLAWLGALLGVWHGLALGLACGLAWRVACLALVWLWLGLLWLGVLLVWLWFGVWLWLVMDCFIHYIFLVSHTKCRNKKN